MFNNPFTNFVRLLNKNWDLFTKRFAKYYLAKIVLHLYKMSDNIDECESYYSEYEDEYYFISDKREPKINSTQIPYDDPCNLPPPCKDYQFTIVMDLDETLITSLFIRAGSNYDIFLRPYAKSLLEDLNANNYEIIIWTAGVESHLKKALLLLDPENKLIHHSICRGTSWYKGEGPIIKSLDLIPHRSFNKMLLIENNKAAAINQYNRTIIVPSFKVSNNQDNILHKLSEWVLQGSTILNEQIQACGDQCSICNKHNDQVHLYKFLYFDGVTVTSKCSLY